MFRGLANCPNFGVRVENALLAILVYFEATLNFSVLNFLIASCYFVRQNCLYFSFKMVISEICTCS